MTDLSQFVERAQEALLLSFAVSAPFVISGVVLGVAISFVQAMTQVQEQAVGFMFKLIAVFLIFVFAGSLIGGTVVAFTRQVFEQMRGL